MTDLEVLIHEYGVAVLCKGKENLPRQIKRILEAARATPADHSRDDTIEDCAKVCDAMANQVEDERQFALDLCSDAIRALKSQQDAARSGEGS